jgi:hypothetical protein
MVFAKVWRDREFGSDLEQVASFVDRPPRFISLGKIECDGLIADMANREIGHMGSHGSGLRSDHPIAQGTDARNGVRWKGV